MGRKVLLGCVLVLAFLIGAFSMKVTMWGSDVPYKNLQQVIPVDGGLNAIGSPISLSDGQWTKHYGWDFNYDGSISQHDGDWNVLGTIHGHVYGAQYLKGNYNLFCFYKMNQGASYVHFPSEDKWRVLNVDTAVETEYAYPTAGCIPFGFYSIIPFHTQAVTYAVCAYENKNTGTSEISAMVYNGGAVSSYTPLIWGTTNVRKLISYSNRIFAITGNVLSWSSAGTWDNWYGALGPDSYVAQDNGYWVFEKEANIIDAVVFNGSLYLFGDRNVYRFSGYSPETFSSDIVLQGVGIYDIDRVCATSNAIYYYSNGEVWEYDGGSSSHSISNGQYVSGGIPINIADSYSGVRLEVDGVNISVKLTKGLVQNPTTNTNDEYLFNIKNRKWTVRGSVAMSIIQTQTYNTFRAVVADVVNGAGDDVTIDIVSNVGLESLKTYGDNIGANPYALESKAFTTGPSTNMVLNAIWLQYKLDDEVTPTDIKVYITTDTNGTDWELVSSMENVIGDGNITTERIIIPNKLKIWSPFYRIKIDCNGALMTLYPMTIETRSKLRQ